MQLKSNDKSYINEGNIDILRLIDEPNSHILDVGCGGGSVVKLLSFQGHIVDGITISPDEVALAKPNARNIYLHNLENGLPDSLQNEQYDYVICSHVLEHIVY